ncbi:hypothetical protein LTR17_000735 [Elasticomyces elasticus]|nr:hypothetical protein LTR17_000735 [Elasticomyces elasticus]
MSNNSWQQTTGAFNNGPIYPHQNNHASSSRLPSFMDAANEQIPEQSIPPMTQDANFDILEWHPAYQSCQRYFVDHAQHEPATQALCALINIRLPFQWLANPVTSSKASQSTPGSSYGFNPLPRPGASVHSPNRPRSDQATPAAVSLVPYVRRLVVTAFDKPPILHGLFGDDYVRGILPHVDCERRNYLFAAKHGGWRTCKKQYDVGSGGGGVDETVPFMKPLDEAKMEELTAAEKAWSSWLAMEDWMVGPRAPDDNPSAGGRQDISRTHLQIMSSLELHAANLARDMLETRERARVSLLYALAARLQSLEDETDELERSDLPANALFATYELLEMVLLYLPIHDLLNARAVDKTFLAVIGRSQKIQRSLYLLADGTQVPSDVPPVLNGLLDMADPRLGPWRLKQHGHAANDDGTYDYGLYYELDDDTYSRGKALTMCDGITKPGLWQTYAAHGQPSQPVAMAPKTPEEALERYAARHAEDLLASRHLVKTYQPRLYQRRKLPITGSITHSVMERLQRVDALAHTVFNTYELLEMILLHLPLRDLLFACGASKTFHDIINRSEPIQQALFMKPDTTKLLDGESVTVNDLLWFDHMPKYGPWRIDGAELSGSTEVCLGHWLGVHYFRRAKPIEKREGYGASGSWEKMYLTRPVTDEVLLMYSETIASDQWREYMDDTATCGCHSCETLERAKRIASGEEEAEEEVKQESPVLSEHDGDTSSESESEQESDEHCNESSDAETDEEASEQDRVGACAYEDDF